MCWYIELVLRNITFTYAISISRDGFTVPVVGVSDLQMGNPGSPGTTETVGGNV